MERQIPKNVRQIGNVSDCPKIYVEDYVDSFFNQMSEKCTKAGSAPMGAFLIGDILTAGDEEYVYIYGAVQMHDLKMEGEEYLIDDAAWKDAYEDCKQYFEDGEMLGWIVIRNGAPLIPSENMIQLHKRSFPKQNTIFIMRDPAEKEEAYYVHKMGDLMEMGGHYTYYEKNPCMQNYMVSTRKKNGGFHTEAVEDQATRDFRNIVRKKNVRKRGRRPGRLIYAASACLVLIVIVMGVTMMNSVERMRSVQGTLDSLQEKKDPVETVETSGEIKASSGGEAESGADEAVVTDGSSAPGDQQGVSDQADADEEASSTSAEDPSADSTGSPGSGQISGDEDISESGMEEESGTDTGGQASDASQGVYTVEEGDTLAIISIKMYGDYSHVDAICRMNGITDGNLIYVGQKLLLP